jgi:hypothetical protein
MATKVAIAIRQADALERMRQAAGTLQRRFGLAEIDLAPPQRDAGLAQALQMEATATLLENLVEKTTPAPAPASKGGKK